MAVAVIAQSRSRMVGGSNRWQVLNRGGAKLIPAIVWWLIGL